MKIQHLALIAVIAMVLGTPVVVLVYETLSYSPPSSVEATYADRQVTKKVQLRWSSARLRPNGDPDPMEQSFEPLPNGPISLNDQPLLPTVIAGNSDPEMLNIQQVTIPPGESVIGITVAGKAKAYVLDAVSLIQDHVINDVIEGIPVSVTYCNLHDCARVFTQRATEGRIELGVGGVVDDPLTNSRSLALLLDGQRYRQDSPSLPLTDYPFDRMSWQEWTQKHPDTEVFIGEMKRFKRRVAGS